jgi:hypothetical protein
MSDRSDSFCFDDGRMRSIFGCRIWLCIGNGQDYESIVTAKQENALFSDVSSKTALENSRTESSSFLLPLGEWLFSDVSSSTENSHTETRYIILPRLLLSSIIIDSSI